MKPQCPTHIPHFESSCLYLPTKPQMTNILHISPAYSLVFVHSFFSVYVISDNSLTFFNYNSLGIILQSSMWATSPHPRTFNFTHGLYISTPFMHKCPALLPLCSLTVCKNYIFLVSNQINHVFQSRPNIFSLYVKVSKYYVSSNNLFIFSDISQFNIIKNTQ